MQAGTNDNGDGYKSHMFRLSDEQYNKLAAYAAQNKQTPEKLFEVWVSEMTHKTKEPAPLNCKERQAEEHQIHPLLEVAGMFAIREPGWADKHDEYLAEICMESHTNGD